MVLYIYNQRFKNLTLTEMVIAIAVENICLCFDLTKIRSRCFLELQQKIGIKLNICEFCYFEKGVLRITQGKSTV